MRRRALRGGRGLLAATLTVVAAGCAVGPPAATRPPPAGRLLEATLRAEVALSGLEHPTAIRFGTDGRAWVAEQAGRIKVFDALPARAPAMEADISGRVLGRNNRGLLGLAPDPADPSAAYLLSTFPAPPGRTEPIWADDASNCPRGGTRSCVSVGELSRVAFSEDGTFAEVVLARGWCHHHASHAPNELVVGPDGALYAAAGEGSVPNLERDDGTWLPESERCNEGALTSRASPEDRAPGEWAGAVTRFAAADLADVAAGRNDPAWLADRATVVAVGLRNPFRMAFRPGTPELWIADPGWETWEEIDVIADASDDVVEDFGWPCLEGPDELAVYADDPRCAALLEADGATAPWFAMHRADPRDPTGTCSIDASAITAIAFAPPTWPGDLAGALLFADQSRGCAYLAPAGAGGLPDAARVRAAWLGSGSIVDLRADSTGAVHAVGFVEGTVTMLRPHDDP